MLPETKIASYLVIEHSNKLIKSYPNYDFQFGIIFYNDPIDITTDFNDYIQLTKELNKIKYFVDKWNIQSGGDEAEDWVGGYNIALNKINWRNVKKIVVHICDAPAHG